MITPDFCRTMARYNEWQNQQIRAACEKLTEAELRADRGAFFGSVMETLNHLLWGDGMWMARFDGGDKPEGGISDSTSLCPTLAAWGAERFRMDQRIKHWAEKVRAVELSGDLAWYSGALGREMKMPKALCVTHMFNHQTHHRGQVHAMLTAAGVNPGDTDLPFMPEENAWR